jgi:hypothetical protein
LCLAKTKEEEVSKDIYIQMAISKTESPRRFIITVRRDEKMLTGD